jgi:hypothetical protein
MQRHARQKTYGYKDYILEGGMEIRPEVEGSRETWKVVRLPGVEDIDVTAYVLLFFDLEDRWKWPSKSGTCFLDKDSRTNSWLDSQPPNAGHKMA